MDDWGENRKLILDGLEQSKKDRAFLICKYNQLRTDYEVLKVKVSFISAGIATGISIAAAVVIKILDK